MSNSYMPGRGDDALFNYERRKSHEVTIGNLKMGGNNPIRIQSMANTDTNDTEGSVEQCIRIIEAGGELVRYTAQGVKEAKNLENIRKELTRRGYTTPLVADIHFNPNAADEAALHVEKVRINPGNYVDSVHTQKRFEYTDEEYAQEIEKIRARLVPFLNICKEHNTAIRIGVNHGSLSDRIISRYGDTPKGMVESCMEFLRICRDEKFDNVVISIKASNTVIMVQTVRLLSATMQSEGMDFPLHIGVTEAGNGEDGRIKSAVGIGALLADGIGDTIRVSLSEAPECEIPVAKSLADYIQSRSGHQHIDAHDSGLVDPYTFHRRKTIKVGKFGGGNVPCVISNSSQGESKPDYVFGRDILSPGEWNEGSKQIPIFCKRSGTQIKECSAEVKIVMLAANAVEEVIPLIDDRCVLMINATGSNFVGEIRAALHKLMKKGVQNPVILKKSYDDKDKSDFQVKCGADFGVFLIDGLADGIWIEADNISDKDVNSAMFGILQASRSRMSKTEFISCPSCGRTMFDLQTTLARIKEKTSHLKHLKIGVMGCIVNGPGEMADADYGYVGSGRNRVNLYKGQECIKKMIPEEEAVDKLIELIKENGDWVEPK